MRPLWVRTTRQPVCKGLRNGLVKGRVQKITDLALARGSTSLITTSAWCKAEAHVGYKASNCGLFTSVEKNCFIYEMLSSPHWIYTSPGMSNVATHLLLIPASSQCQATDSHGQHVAPIPQPTLAQFCAGDCPCHSFKERWGDKRGVFQILRHEVKNENCIEQEATI